MARKAVSSRPNVTLTFLSAIAWPAELSAGVEFAFNEFDDIALVYNFVMRKVIQKIVGTQICVQQIDVVGVNRTVHVEVTGLYAGGKYNSSGLEVEISNVRPN